MPRRSGPGSKCSPTSSPALSYSTGLRLGAEDDGSQCFEVYAVYGVSRCDISKLGAVQRRNKLEKKDEHWSYEACTASSA